jgi:hypothetical protein
VAARADSTATGVDAAISSLMTKAGLASRYAVTKDDPAAVTPGQSLHVKVRVPYANVKLLGLSMIPMPSAPPVALSVHEGPTPAALMSRITVKVGQSRTIQMPWRLTRVTVLISAQLHISGNSNLTVNYNGGIAAPGNHVFLVI